MVGRAFPRAVALSFVAFLWSQPLQAQPADGPIGQVREPLVAGTLVDDAEREGLGLLTLGPGTGNCSASLLANDWAVTASHCLSVNNVRQPATVTLRARWGAPEQVRNPDRIYRFWGTDAAGPNLDVALLHVPTPFTVNGSDRGYARAIDTRDLADMKNETVQVYGRGISGYAFTDVNGNPQMSLSDDLFRKGTFTVDQTDAVRFWYRRNAAGQIVAGGDSGGPSFVRGTDGAMRLVGVHALCRGLMCLPGSSCTDPATGACNCGNANDWNWVTSIDRCGDAPVGGRVAWAIEDLMRQDWDPARTVAALDVRDSERYVGAGFALDGLDRRGWAEVQRAASRMCANRGFAAGFATGRRDEYPVQANAAPNDGYGIVCLNETTGQWFDATQAQVNASGDGFADINAVGWAQAARAANGVCQGLVPGSPGGKFTGFTADYGSGQVMGVFCLNATGGQWADALTPDLSAYGEPVGDLNATNWAGAARAASAWCVGRGYPNGGFLNGHQLDQKRGTICVGPRTSNPDDRFDTSAVAYPPATVYAVAANGDLLWYQNANSSRPGGSRDWLGPRKVGNGWGGFKDVVSDGGPVVYAVQPDGTLLWYGHDGFVDGGANWRTGSPTTVGSGWAGFRQIVPAGEYVMYGIRPDGALLWYRNDGAPAGAANWVGPRQVGTGWQNFKSVFSGGDGVIYAIQPDGRLLRYVHKGYLTGDATWEGPQEIGTGWAGFKQVFAALDGVIYAIQPDGKLLWYRYGKPHPPAPGVGGVADRVRETDVRVAGGPSVGGVLDRVRGGNARVVGRTEGGIRPDARHADIRVLTDAPRWEGPVEVGTGWGTFTKVFPVMATPPSIVR